MANESDLKLIIEKLDMLNDRLGIVETKTNAALATPSTRAVVTTGGSPDNGNGIGTNVNKPTASDDADYWAAAFQAGLALSQQRGYKDWQTAVAALLPAVTRAIDESSQGNTSVIAPAVAPAAISGAAYFLGRYITR